MPKKHAHKTTAAHGATGKTADSKHGIVVPDFLFRKKSPTPRGSFRTVYGRSITNNDLRVSPSDFVTEKAEHAKAIIEAACGMLDDVILNWTTRFNLHEFLQRVATIESRMIMLIRSGMVNPNQPVVSKLSDELHRIVRVLFFPVADLQVLALMVLQVAKQVSKISFREDATANSFFGGTSSIGKATAWSRMSLVSKLSKANLKKLSTLDNKRKTFCWSGDKKIDAAIHNVEEAYYAWKGTGFLIPTFGTTEEIHELLDTARAILWQLHFKMIQKDPRSAAVLFEEMDEVMFRTSSLDPTMKDLTALSKWGAQRTKWQDRLKNMLVDNMMRAVKWVAKQGARAVLIGELGIDLDVGFVFDLAAFAQELMEADGTPLSASDLAHFDGFEDSAFEGKGHGFSVLKFAADVHKTAELADAAEGELPDASEMVSGALQEQAAEIMEEKVIETVDEKIEDPVDCKRGSIAEEGTMVQATEDMGPGEAKTGEILEEIPEEIEPAKPEEEQARDKPKDGDVEKVEAKTTRKHKKKNHKTLRAKPMI